MSRRSAATIMMLGLVLVLLSTPLAARQAPLERLPLPDTGPAAVQAPPVRPEASWQYGPPSSFQYQRFDGAFVPGPNAEPWANMVYFMGGRVAAPSELPDIWSFDPLTGSYADTGADMIEDVSNYNANLILDDGTGRGPAVYVIGGYDKDNTSANVGLVQRYYPQSNVSESLPPADNWPGLVGGITVGGMGTAVVNDQVYVFGGWQSTSFPYFGTETWRFDPASPSGSRWVNLGIQLSTGRSYIQSAAQSGKVYAIGGIYQYVGGDLVPTDVVEVLDTANVAAGWQPLASLPVPTAEGRAFGFDDDTLSRGAPWLGKLYVVGGGDWPATGLEAMEYDIATDTWDRSFPDLNEDRVNHAGVFIPLCTPDPDDGLPGMWVFGGRWDNGCDPPYGPTEYYPMSCIGDCTVLLVDDDWDFDTVAPNDGGRPYYTSALDLMGFSYDVWDTGTMSTPTSAELDAYDAVVWFTGYDWQTPISPTEEVELVNYLDGGGALLVSSQEQEYAFPGSAILTDYLGVLTVTEDVVLTGTLGNPADPLFAGMGTFPMARPDQWAPYWPIGGFEGPFDDEVVAAPLGLEPLLYTVSGAGAAARFEGTSFRTTYLAFPFEWLPDLQDRARLLDATLVDWFGCNRPCVSLTSAAITGPSDVLVNEPAVYSVTLEPGMAVEPISLEWSNGLTGTVAAYGWPAPGVYTVTVTATNCGGTAVVGDSLLVTVHARTVFFPLVLKN